MLQKGAVEEVADPTSPGLYCHMFTRPKKTGGTRPIINLRPLNAYLQIPTFKMQTVAELLTQVQPGDWAASVDLKDAYFHVGIKRSFRKYLRFVVGGRAYQFRALPFGLATAPRVFTQLVKQIAQRVHQQGCQFHYYIDDWLIRGPSKELVQQQVQMVVKLCQELGLVINWAKSELTPSQTFTYIGVTFDTRQCLCKVPVDRQAGIREQVRSLLQARQASALTVLRVLGQLGAAEKLTPYGRIHLRQLQWDLHQQWRHPQDRRATLVVLSGQALTDLHWWLTTGAMSQGVPLGRFQPQEQLFSDASLTQWGACLLSGPTVQGIWTTQWNASSINALELQAVLEALRHFQCRLSGKAVLIVCDNTSAVYYVNKQGGTRNRLLMTITRQIYQWAELHRVWLLARHIPGKLNVLADGLSRSHQILPTEWKINPRVLQRVWRVWHRPHIDLFATRFNHQLEVYISPCPDPQAWAIDALNTDWTGFDAYAYPPTSLIPQVLRRIRQFRCRVILIAPYWPSCQWFPELLELIVEQPLELPVIKTLLRQSHNYRLHPEPQRLLLHAWRLSGVRSETEAFRTRWPTESPELPAKLLP
jgi:hypothetical protein